MPNTKEPLISESTHPEYDYFINRWCKWRLTYEGGEPFLDTFLKKFSQREDKWDFENRKAISYVPAYAKSSINEIKNAIFQRMVDITRKNGTPSYMNAIAGRDKGVDRESRTMNNFIGSQVLPELLSMGKVGVLVDMPRYIGTTQIEQIGKNPYLHIYRTEDIRNWAYEEDINPTEFRSLLLRDYVYVNDPITGLPVDVIEEYRLLYKNETGNVAVRIFDCKGDELSERELILQIKRIPFVVFQLSQSLLTDVADIQVALMNLASADMNYSFKSNFPFYTEQFDPRRISGHLRQNNAALAYTPSESSGDITSEYPGTQAAADTSKPQEIVTGATRGRRYPIGTERPSYISPSPEPLRVSMEKQDQLTRDIKLLINLALSNMVPRKQISAESRALDDQSLEAGLSYVGQELEHGETLVAEYWAMFERSRKDAIIRYPTHYSLKSDDQRLEESAKLAKLRADVNSITYQREVSKLIAATILSDRTDPDTMTTINNQIDKAVIPIVTSDVISQDIEDGILSRKTASKAKNYPEGEVELSSEEHAERAARIVAAQTDAAANKNMAARGVAELDPNTDSSTEEKASSQKVKELDATVTDKTRGEAK